MPPEFAGIDKIEATAVSEVACAQALERGRRQLGTLGSGNHFAEVQYVEEIHDSEAAEAAFRQAIARADTYAAAFAELARGHRRLADFTAVDLTTFSREMAYLSGVRYGGVVPL